MVVKVCCVLCFKKLLLLVVSLSRFCMNELVYFDIVDFGECRSYFVWVWIARRISRITIVIVILVFFVEILIVKECLFDFLIFLNVMLSIFRMYLLSKFWCFVICLRYFFSVVIVFNLCVEFVCFINLNKVCRMYLWFIVFLNVFVFCIYFIFYFNNFVISEV